MPEEDIKKLQADPTMGQSGSVGRTPGGFVNTITGEMLQPATPVNFQTPTSSPVFPVASLNTEIPELKLTQPETQADDLSKRLQDLNQQLGGQSALRTQKEAELGVPELVKSQRDLSTRLKTLQAEALAIPLRIEEESVGRGRTAGGVSPLIASDLRKNAIQALSVGAMLEATRGNLTTALDLVDRAVGQKFDPIKEEIAIKQANLDLILKSPSYSLAEKNRAQAQLNIQKAKEKEVAKQEADQKTIWEIATKATANGLTDQLVLERIRNAKTPEEALQIAAPYMQNPKAKFELEEARLNNILKREQIETERVKRGQIGVDKDKDTSKADEETKRAILAAQDQINSIDKLLTHGSLESAVGPSLTKLFSRAGFQGGGKGDFIASVSLLTSQGTLKSLLDLKRAGGTLGALSEGERETLKQSFTKISVWEVKKDGQVVGYNTTENNFRRELERIKTLAQRALKNAQGELIDDGEEEALNTFFSTGIGGVSTPAFNPANFF